MSSDQRRSARKRLNLDEIEDNGNSSKHKNGRFITDKSKNLKAKQSNVTCKTSFERPNTRLKNGIQRPKHAFSPDRNLTAVKSKDKACKQKNEKQNSRSGESAEVQSTSKSTDKSNNNASGNVDLDLAKLNAMGITKIPDPSKYVLTKWGDVNYSRKEATDT